MILAVYVATCMFICCDSAKSRKVFAFSLAGSGIVGLMSYGLAGIPNLVLALYWAYEMNKLADLAEETEKEGGDEYTRM